MRNSPLHFTLAALLGVTGCAKTHQLAEDVGSTDVSSTDVGSTDAGATDAATPAADAFDTGPIATIGSSVRVREVENVDLLLMVDNSNSMAEEQANLLRELPRLVQALAAGDRDGDGLRDFRPVRSLHVGVVTSDLGAGPNSGVPTCRPGLGDDGILRSTSPDTTAPCMASFPSGIFTFAGTIDDAAAFAATVGCVANVGTGGCGFEQQLEAPLKALTPLRATAWTRPGYTPPLFVSAEGIPNSVGGNGEAPGNAGFLRANSALAVVIVTDEEDCSVLDYNLFARDSPRFGDVSLNVRCNQFGAPDMGAVHPVDRYIAGFLGLRADPAMLVFAAVVGIPQATEGAAARGAFARVLENPAMIPRLDATATNLIPSCTTDDGVAYPPVRIVQTAAGLARAGATVSLSSICRPTFQPAVDNLLLGVAEVVGDVCLPLPLSVNASGVVECELFELLPPTDATGLVTSCAALPGRTLARVERDEFDRVRELCVLTQLDRSTALAGSTPGWYYDDFDPRLPELCGAAPRRLAFTAATAEAAAADLYLVCR